MAQPDLSTIMQQAQALQDKLKQMQEDAASRTVEAQAGGGMVRVVVDGSMQVRSIQIEPALLNDAKMLEDLLLGAINDGLRRAQTLVAQEVGKLAGPLAGFKLPGME
ncbi:MAG TPA: YbaB/EbfC family nucleoid-associated protein [Candidatus Binataceae bacterium]|nr:YbaB/EbfC family nucleoid-associated protein [Candidatus Binataceae bacterium]